jgi:hypothetical protein
MKLIKGVVFLALCAAVVAAPVQREQMTDQNAVGQFSAIGNAGVRYYCETGSSLVKVLDQNLTVTGRIQVRAADGTALALDKVYFDSNHNVLLGAVRRNELTTVYRINPVTGAAVTHYKSAQSVEKAIKQAALIRRGSTATEQVAPQLVAIDSNNPESIAAYEAYGRWLVNHTATAAEKSLMERFVFPQAQNDGDRRGLDESGGPDAFGYSYKDSNEPDGPNYSWTELCGDPDATAILSNVDDGFETISWVNAINIYGTSYTGAFVSTNGLISFSEGNSTFTNRCPLSAGEPVSIGPELYVNWDDHFASGDGGCSSSEAGPWVLYRDFGTHVVIEWAQIPGFSDRSNRSTFECILYPSTGEILYQYNNLSLEGQQFSSTVGIDDPGAGNGLQYGSCETTFANGTDDLAILFTPVLATPGFLSVDWEFPAFSCVDGVLSPSAFDLTVHLCNEGGSPCDFSEFSFGDGLGAGGTIDFEPNTQNVGTLAPGECRDIIFQCVIAPSGVGGAIQFGGQVSSSCGTFFIDFIHIAVPGCTGEPGDCGCTDVAFVIDVTGSMGGAIDNVRNELPNIMASAVAASGGDVRFGLVVFEDQVGMIQNMTFDQAAMQAAIATLSAGGGANIPEASDEALREVITHDAECYNGRSHFATLREGCTKIIVLVTDALPGGCDDQFTPGVDDVNANQRALDALGIDATIAAVYVPTFGADGAVIAVMLNYADVSNGAYAMVNGDGSGTGAAIADIIAACGGDDPDDCLPEGPDCNGAQPSFVSQVLGKIENTVLRVAPAGGLEMSWEAIDGAQFYQVYTSSIMDDEYNWAPFAMSYTNSLVIPAEEIQSSEDGQSILYHVKAIQTVQNIIGSDIACWPLDEGADALAEDFAQDNDGTIEGADWVAGPSGHPCLHFEHGDRVVVENDVEFYGRPLQVDACVTINQYPTIPSGPYYIFSCHRYATWFEGFGLRIDNRGRLLCQVWNATLNNWQTLYAPVNRVVPLGVPFHVTAVINGRESMILLNGEVVATGRQDYESITNGFSMTIGAHHYNDDFGEERYQYHMRGDIHWLKIAQFEE